MRCNFITVKCKHLKDLSQWVLTAGFTILPSLKIRYKTEHFHPSRNCPDAPFQSIHLALATSTYPQTPIGHFLISVAINSFCLSVDCIYMESFSLIFNSFPFHHTWFCGNKDHPVRTSKGYLSRTCSNKGVSYHHLYFGTDPKASRKVGKLNSG